MSRDYKQTDHPPAKRSGSPLFTGILIGLFVGLAVAIGVAVYINFSPKPFVSRDKPPAQPAEAAKVPAKGADVAQKTSPADSPDRTAKTTTKPRFDFYTILPDNKEPGAKQEPKLAKRPDAPAKERFFLQVGAFQAATEADNLKARLALLGLEAVIQTASIPDKGVWHRVRVGPFASIEDMNRARALLAQNNLSSSLVKVHEAGTP